jgi:hypothetical protein
MSFYPVCFLVIARLLSTSMAELAIPDKRRSRILKAYEGLSASFSLSYSAFKMRFYDLPNAAGKI